MFAVSSKKSIDYIFTEFLRITHPGNSCIESHREEEHHRLENLSHRTEVGKGQ
jgi:hypothetical protein